MGEYGLEITLIFLLVIANGVFSMTELAVVSARKIRLQQKAEEGSKGAQAALDLAANPNDFLSTVQVGITMIGTLAGAFGGATIAEKLALRFKDTPYIGPYAETVSMGIVVLVITYLSLVIGELVPKSLALGHAESIASALAPLMKGVSKVGSPLVRFLTFSTEMVMKLIPVKKGAEAPVTEEEIKALIAQGAEHGTFGEAEQEMVAGVFRLADRRVAEMMTHRQKIRWLDVGESWESNQRVITSSSRSRFLVSDGDLDKLVGVVHVKDILAAMHNGAPVNLRDIAKRPLVAPEATPALQLLERFQETGDQIAVIVDEHATIQGVVTITDLMRGVLGDLPNADEGPRPSVVLRQDGSWLIDGTVLYPDMLETLAIRELPQEEEGFTTVAGFVLAHLQRIPSAGDHFVAANWRFEVLDMDGNRIDKVLAAPVSSQEADDEPQG
ncbi:hypothetical protein F183_A00760 [Bryobacterales bacterium F-183]|nr:hypothetical protein F183_A00760 [Bryobacterales bacterium F-183]